MSKGKFNRETASLAARKSWLGKLKGIPRGRVFRKGGRGSARARKAGQTMTPKRLAAIRASNARNRAARELSLRALGYFEKSS